MRNSEPYNWRAFYTELGRLGPSLLRGTPDYLADSVAFESKESDAFWSDGLEGTLDACWNTGPEAAVTATLYVWLENVQTHLRDILGPDSLLPWTRWGVSKRARSKLMQEVDEMTLELCSSTVLQLAAAAEIGLRSSDSPTLVIQAAIFAERKVSDGEIIRAVSIPWQLIVERLRNDWSQAYLIKPRSWEELIAAAFDQDGYDEVTLTPSSGDRGRDVIAVKKGVGSVRILGSVKAHKPGHLVGHDDVRALGGLLLSDLNASKGIVMTTSDFAPGIVSDPYIKPLIPYRMELMNGPALREWLVKIVERRK